MKARERKIMSVPGGIVDRGLQRSYTISRSAKSENFPIGPLLVCDPVSDILAVYMRDSRDGIVSEVCI